MKYIILGDTHGRDIWKSFPLTDYDRIIWLGDYVDSFDKSDTQILHNLNEIIQLKIENPDRIILLLGNHDLQYLFSYASNGCSGFRPKMYPYLHSLFNDNKKLFQAAYQIDNYLFTHAGISSVWWNKFWKVVQDFYPNDENLKISDIINENFKVNKIDLYDVGRSRGGWCKSGGPFWCDKSELMAYMLPDYIQIIGHTPVKEITIHENKQQNAKAIFCDTTYDYYELEI